MVATLLARPAAMSLRISQGAAAAKVATTKPTSDIASRVLPNGLEIIVFEDHSVPIVTVELAVRNGSFTEPPELNGLSHLYEHMFFKAKLDSSVSPTTARLARKSSNTTLRRPARTYARL